MLFQGQWSDVRVALQDEGSLSKLVDNVRSNFNDRGEELNRKWGGGVMGAKSQVSQFSPRARDALCDDARARYLTNVLCEQEKTRQKEKAIAREAAKRMQA